VRPSLPRIPPPAVVARRARAAAGRIDRRFWIPIVVIAVLGVGLRLAVIQAAEPCGSEPVGGCFPSTGDAFEYRFVAEALADGKGFTRPGGGEAGHHPPVMAVYLSGWRFLGVEGYTGLRRSTALLGAVTVALVAAVAHRLAGRRAGWAAAVLAALHPALWVNDVVLMSESVYQVAAALVAWAGYRFWRRRTLGSAVVLGAACGLAALSRTEGALLAPLIAVALAAGMVELRRRDRLGLVAAVGATSILVVAPWLHLNATRFDKPALMTTTTGQSLLLTNQPTTYYGDRLGSKAGYEQLGAGSVRARLGRVDESTVDERLVEASDGFRRGNVGRLPVVVVARIAREWGLYRPTQMARDDHVIEGRGDRPSDLAWWAHGLVAPLGLAGIVVLYRRRVPVSPLVALLAAGTFTAAVNFGLTRYRAGADVALVIAAGVALVALSDAARTHLLRTGDQIPRRAGEPDRQLAWGRGSA
jgi:4-amino-4-deoxy-L-arabinose transferase-like glycosyltransferase